MKFLRFSMLSQIAFELTYRLFMITLITIVINVSFIEVKYKVSFQKLLFRNILNHGYLSVLKMIFNSRFNWIGFCLISEENGIDFSRFSHEIGRFWRTIYKSSRRHKIKTELINGDYVNYITIRALPHGEIETKREQVCDKFLVVKKMNIWSKT